MEVFLAEHPHHPRQVLFAAVLGLDRVAQPASGCFVHRVLNRVIHWMHGKSTGRRQPMDTRVVREPRKGEGGRGAREES